MGITREGEGVESERVSEWEWVGQCRAVQCNVRGKQKKKAEKKKVQAQCKSEVIAYVTSIHQRAILVVRSLISTFMCILILLIQLNDHAPPLCIGKFVPLVMSVIIQKRPLWLPLPSPLPLPLPCPIYSCLPLFSFRSFFQFGSDRYFPARQLLFPRGSNEINFSSVSSKSSHYRTMSPPLPFVSVVYLPSTFLASFAHCFPVNQPASSILNRTTVLFFFFVLLNVP